MGGDGRMNEADWEDLAKKELDGLGWTPGEGKDFAPGSAAISIGFMRRTRPPTPSTAFLRGKRKSESFTA